ncbi:MAG TPA: hypothetical protein PKC28_04695, partial [Bdellovibrionales bacterium]|nr:hypothetical protein [Bdellovibrionales bacterium]
VRRNQQSFGWQSSARENDFDIEQSGAIGFKGDVFSVKIGDSMDPAKCQEFAHIGRQDRRGKRRARRDKVTDS